MNPRRALGVIAATLIVPALASCGGGSSAATAPNFTSLSQLNAIWTLNGTVAFNCNGTAEHEAISGVKIRIFGGSFDERDVPLPTYACGIGTIRFQGAIDLTGSVTGNVSTTTGNPILSDTISGTCTAASCSGQSVNTALLSPFTLSNTMENVYDGTNWQLNVRCSDGNQMALRSSGAPPSIDNGGTLQGAGSTCSGLVCTASGSTTSATSNTFSLSGTASANGTLAATFAQGAAGSLTFSGGPSSSLTALGGTGTFGSTITLTQCSNTQGGSLPPCSNCITSARIESR